MNRYNMRWRRIRRFGWTGLWRKEGPLIGHSLDRNQDKMILYFEDGSLREIAKWADCEVRLGTDWVLATKDQMEKEANQPVKLNVNAGGK